MSAASSPFSYQPKYYHLRKAFHVHFILCSNPPTIIFASWNAYCVVLPYLSSAEALSAAPAALSACWQIVFSCQPLEGLLQRREQGHAPS